jgi:hypothetical protein
VLRLLVVTFHFKLGPEFDDRIKFANWRSAFPATKGSCIVRSHPVFFQIFPVQETVQSHCISCHMPIFNLPVGLILSAAAILIPKLNEWWFIVPVQSFCTGHSSMTCPLLIAPFFLI